MRIEIFSVSERQVSPLGSSVMYIARFLWVTALLFSCLCVGWIESSAAQSIEPLALDGQISADGTKVGLSWESMKSARVQVFRRNLGATGAESWQEITPRVKSRSRFLDDGLSAGQAYEYQVRLEGQGAYRIGYWATGRRIPDPVDTRTALVIVDDTLADALVPYLDRFELDLIGDGWKVERHLAPRALRKDPEKTMKHAQDLRDWIAERYWADPFSSYAVILIGHLPVVRTGKVGPDGHKKKSVPTDLYYADPEGYWLKVRDAKGKPQFLHGVLPADHIKMQIGRIDFAKLGAEFGGELPLLRAYFDKNHHWRHGRLGDTRQAYWKSSHLRVEQYALRNIVGPAAIREGGHHDMAGQGPFLLGVDFGSYKGKQYAELPPSEAVFTINFGSGKHIFDGKDNPMTALLAQPWYPLTVGWGSRPAWQLHGLAMGESIGQAHMRTVNNGTASKGGMSSREYVPTGKYNWINPPWVNLIGDPTLKPCPLASVTAFKAEAISNGVKLSWRKPVHAEGVLLYRANARAGPYKLISEGEIQTEETYVDTDPTAGAWYMIRARGLAEVYAGSFYRLSQGRFAKVENTPPIVIKRKSSIEGNTPVVLEWPVSDSNKGDTLLISPIRGPGRAVQQSDKGIVLDPSKVSQGAIHLSFTVFDGVASEMGVLEVDVTKVVQ